VVTGYTPEEFYQDPGLIYRMIHPADQPVIKKILQGYDPNQPIQLRWVHKNGSLVWVEQYTVPIFDRSGNVVALESMARQIPSNLDQDATGNLTRQRKRLLDISQSIASNFSIDEVMRHIIQALEDLLAFDCCSFWIKEDELRLLQMFDRIRSEYVSKTVRTGTIYPGSSVENQVLHSGEAQLSRVEHKMVIPLSKRENRLGVITLTRRFGPPFTDEEFEVSQLCIAYASLAIENAHLCKKNETRSQLITHLGPSIEGLVHPFNIAEISEAIGQEALLLASADRIAVFAYKPDFRLSRLWSRGLSFAYLGHITMDRHGMLEHQPVKGLELKLTSRVLDLPEGSPARLLAEAEGYQAVAICPLIIGSRVIACVACYYNQPHYWSKEEKDALLLFSRQAANALENTRLYEELEETYLQTVLTLARAIDARDTYTADHSRRLADWAEATARRLRCSAEEVQLIRWAALLHDIGKIGIPDSILRKAGPLTEEEWQVMRQHPILGADIIAPVAKLQPVTSIIRHHQEKYDGTGYPDGLQGEEIPLAARILTVVDAYGAMTDERIYRRARTKDEAAAELQRCAGTHFDQQVVDVFFELIDANPTH